MTLDSIGKSGIYGIRCVQTSKVYIGSGVDISVRWTAHRVDLRKGRHWNKHLQRSWIKYGEAAFDFFVIEHTSRDSLLTRETVFIEAFKACDSQFGFNVCPTGWSRLGMPHTEETKRKVSLANTGNKSRLGRPHTEETKRKMSAAQKGRSVSVEQRAKISASLRGRVLSEATRSKLSLAKAGKPKPKGFGLRVSRAQAFFSEEQVVEVRRLAVSGISRREIGRRFGTCHKVVKKALQGLGPFYSSI